MTSSVEMKNCARSKYNIGSAPCVQSHQIVIKEFVTGIVDNLLLTRTVNMVGFINLDRRSYLCINNLHLQCK